MRKLIGLIALLLALSGHAGTETTMPVADYRLKTQGGVVGHVAGLLSGFEFVRNMDGTPMAPLPGEWFSLLKGPYGGGSAHGGAGVSRMIDGGIGSDDDYHIDFFNQHILSECGVFPSHSELLKQWRSHAVSDWGGGDKAMEIMRKQKLTPPYTGLFEYGNFFHWCTEAYIENETLGMAAPGMPVTAYRLAERFATVTGDYESVDWALFWATAYAQAYLETDARQAMASAAGTLAEESHSRAIYDACVSLRESEAAWETAVQSIDGMRFGIAGCDNVQCSPDVNNGFAILAVLYGDNDWLKSVRYASVSGYDADCTAATVGGLMGIIKGLGALPEVVRAEVWQDGSGIYVNDTLFTPHIAKEYPAKQTFGELAELYIQNGLKQIEMAGGRLENGILYLPSQTIVRHGVQIDDFEAGTGKWKAEEGTVVLSDKEAHTGSASAQIKLTHGTAAASMSREISDLIPRQMYRLTSYIKTEFDGQAFMSVRDIRTTAYNANKGWLLRELYFEAWSQTERVILGSAQMPQDPGISVWFDDVRIEQVDSSMPIWTQAEPATLEKRDEMQWTLDVPSDGDWAVAVEYQSSQRTGQVMAQFLLDGETLHNAAFPGTGQAGQPGSGMVHIPVRAEKGEHQIGLNILQGGLTVLRIGLMPWPSGMLADSYTDIR